MPWCDARGFAANEREGITPCFAQSVFALGPVLFFFLAAPFQYHHALSSPRHAAAADATDPMGAGLVLVDKWAGAKRALSVVVALAPLLAIGVALATHATALYSGAFFTSRLLTSLCWLLTLPLLEAEASATIALPYPSWVLLCFWLLSFISGGFGLLASKAMLGAPSFAAAAAAGRTQVLADATAVAASFLLVLFGFLCPKTPHYGTSSSITSIQQQQHQAEERPEPVFPIRDHPWWWQRIWRGLSGGPHATTPAQEQTRLLPPSSRGYATTTEPQPELGTPSVVMRRRQRHRKGSEGSVLQEAQAAQSFVASDEGGGVGGIMEPASPFYQAFLRTHAPLVGGGGGSVTVTEQQQQEQPSPPRPTSASTSPPSLLEASRPPPSHHHRASPTRTTTTTAAAATRRPRGLSLFDSGASGSLAAAAAAAGGSAMPLYHLSIPRWLLVDAEGEPVDAQSLLLPDDQSTGQEPEAPPTDSGGGVGAEAAKPPAGPPSMGGVKSPSVLLEGGAGGGGAGLGSFRVAFEIRVEREEAEIEEEDEEEEEQEEGGGRRTRHIPAKGWSVLRTYQAFDGLHRALLRRFYGGTQETAPLAPPSYIGPNRGRPPAPVPQQQEEGERAALLPPSGSVAAGGEGRLVLRVVDVLADMRSLSEYLRSVLALRLACPELRDFLYEEEEEEEEEEEPPTTTTTQQEQQEQQQQQPTAQPPQPERRKELRKLFQRMRKALPPDDHMVRLRTFKDVVSGADIARWLVDARVSPSAQAAAALASEMVEAGYLLPVVRGYAPQEAAFAFQAFRDSRLWLYLYAASAGVGRRMRAPSWGGGGEEEVALLDQEVTLCIPHYRGHGSESISRTDAPASAPPNSFVTYEIVVSTSHEIWSVARRYRDFVRLSRSLRTLGIVPPTSLPGTRGVVAETLRRGRNRGRGQRWWLASVLLGRGREGHGRGEEEEGEEAAFLEGRRRGLEAFLLGVLEAAQSSPQLLGPTVMEFLDADAGDLRIGLVPPPTSAVEEEEGSEEEDDEEGEGGF